MGGGRMRGFPNHFVIRLKESFKSRGTFISLALSSVASLFFWPGSTDSSAAGWNAGTTASGVEGPDLGLALMALWLWLWPALPMLSVSGVITSNIKKVFSSGPLPTLPVGCRTRALAEACVVAVFVLAIQLTAILAVEPRYLFIGHVLREPMSMVELVLHSLSGTAIIFPVLLSWALPARSFEAKWFKPLIWIALILAAVKIGGLATPLLSLVSAGLLSTGVLLTYRLEPDIPKLARKRLAHPDSWFRPYQPSLKLLINDAWRQPISRLGWVILILISVEVVCIILDQHFETYDYTAYFGTTLVLSFFLSLVALRPFGSKQLIASVWGAPGFEPGDFIRAWSVLPIRPVWVLRAVWVHGMVLGLFIWSAAIFVGAFTTWLEVGRFALLDSDGDPVGKLILPQVGAVPCVAGMLLAAAAGNVSRSFLSAVCLVLILAGNVMLIVLRAPVYVHLLVFAVLFFAGALLPLKYAFDLRRLKMNKPMQPGA